MADLGPSLVMGTLTVTKNVITPRVNGLIMGGYHATESYFPSVNGSDGIIQLRAGLDFNHQWGKTAIRIGSGGKLTIDKQIEASSFLGTLTGNASTATTLQTARTINGTSFNGSANITTSLWGTARTLTIGSSGKSVNGSGNVSWSLAEIGAAAASHTHAGSEVTALGNRLTVHSDGKIAVNHTSYRQAGMYGIYDAARIGHIWSMGTQYTIDPNGANFGTLYGLAYKHTNNTTGGNMAGGHQMVWCSNGTPKAAMGESGFWTSGTYNGSGSGLTNLNASNLASGTVPIARISSTASRTSTSTTSLLQAKAMNDHRTSGDHDARYLVLTGGTLTGKLTMPLTYGTWLNGLKGGSAITIDSLGAVGQYSGWISQRTPNYTWGVGTLADDFVIVNMTKANIDGNVNTTSPSLSISSSGVITANGSGLTNLNASNLASGTVPIARISSTAARNSTSVTALLQAKAMNDHVNSGDHDTRYARLNATAQTAGYLYLMRNDAAHPTLYVNQAGAGDIARFFKGSSATATDGNGVVIKNDGTLQMQNSVNWSSDALGSSWARGLMYRLSDNTLEGGIGGYGNVSGLHTVYLGLGVSPWSSGNGIRVSASGVSVTGIMSGRGDGLTNLNASNLATGTVAVARLSGTYSISVSGNAATATKLATARTINGTSFNGTGNILTANWGTSRTLTIGSTGKSVNGSANVAWSLAEIGAQPVSSKLSAWVSSECSVTGQDFLIRNKRALVGTTSNLVVNYGGDFTNVTVQSPLYAASFHGPLTGNASSASTLAFARTINGTSFNGSANITTAQWGTARTLTLGNSAKSVNGSANVSWSLSEMGAVAKAGDTMSGRLSADALGVTNNSATSGKGISLYGGATTGLPEYGLAFAGTTSFGKHGAVQGDWATYFTMTSTNNRGWIFRHQGTNVASISSLGHATFNGNVEGLSDKSLKDDIEPIKDALSKVNQIGGYTYSRNDLDGMRQAGVIAQEVQKILPEVVGSNGELLTVSYGNLTALLIEAIKELSEKVRVLENRTMGNEDESR